MHLCDQKAVKFVQNFESFTFRDDSIASNFYFADGIHLNKTGTVRLLTNINKFIKIFRGRPSIPYQHRPFVQRDHRSSNNIHANGYQRRRQNNRGNFHDREFYVKRNYNSLAGNVYHSNGTNEYMNRHFTSGTFDNHPYRNNWSRRQGLSYSYCNRYEILNSLCEDCGNLKCICENSIQTNSDNSVKFQKNHNSRKLYKNNGDNKSEHKWLSRKGFKMGCLNIHYNMWLARPKSERSNYIYYV